MLKRAGITGHTSQFPGSVVDLSMQAIWGCALRGNTCRDVRVTVWGAAAAEA